MAQANRRLAFVLANTEEVELERGVHVVPRHRELGVRPESALANAERRLRLAAVHGRIGGDARGPQSRFPVRVHALKRLDVVDLRKATHLEAQGVRLLAAVGEAG